MLHRAITIARIALPVLLAVSVGYFLAFRRGWISPDDRVVTALAAVIVALLLFELGLAVVRVVRRKLGVIAFLGRTALVVGLLIMLGSGWAHWALRLRGFVVMAEGEGAPFFHGTHIQEFDAGPLADLEELEVTLHLDRVRLVPAGGGAVKPVSALRLKHHGGETLRFLLSPEKAFVDGPLRFFHGVYGFAPQIAIYEGDDVLFDKTVPFMTRRDEAGRIVFLGEFTVAAHDLYVRGEVSLEGLDDQLRGHPQLVLTVERAGKLLGSGTLLLGGAAELSGGHRAAFIGLRKWAEIDIIRITYPVWMFRGGWIAAGGLAVVIAAFGVGWWRRR